MAAHPAHAPPVPAPASASTSTVTKGAIEEEKQNSTTQQHNTDTNIADDDADADADDERVDSLIAELQIGSSPHASLPSESVAPSPSVGIDSSVCDECGSAGSSYEFVFCGECAMSYCVLCDADYHSTSSDLRHHFRQSRLPGSAYDVGPIPRTRFTKKVKEKIMKHKSQAIQAINIPSLDMYAMMPSKQQTKPDVKKSYMYRAPASTLNSARTRSHRVGYHVSASGGRAARVAASVSHASASHPADPSPPSAPATARPPSRPRTARGAARPATPRGTSGAQSARVRPPSAYADVPDSARSQTSRSLAPPSMHVAPSSTPAHPFLSRSSTHPLSHLFPAPSPLPASGRILLRPGELGAHMTATVWGRKSTPGELVDLATTIDQIKQQIHGLNEEIIQARIVNRKKQTRINRVDRMRTIVLKESTRRSTDPNSDSDDPPSAASKVVVQPSLQMSLLVESDCLAPSSGAVADLRQSNERMKLELFGLEQNVSALESSLNDSQQEKLSLSSNRTLLSKLRLDYAHTRARNDVNEFACIELEKDLHSTLEDMRQQIKRKKETELKTNKKMREIKVEIEQLQKEYLQIQMQLDRQNAEENRPK